jgi:hypothetical protein
LTRTGRLHIFTGSFHHPTLSREMVGDWDLRAVSELVRYLSSTEESVVPELEEPVYAPETLLSKLYSEENRQNQAGSKNRTEQANTLESEERNAYIELIKNELRDKNCLIVASAESNPYTEVVLAHAYNVSPDKSEADHVCFNEPKTINYNWTIALKGYSKKGSFNKKRVDDTQKRPRCFSRPSVKKSPKPGYRGFLFDAHKVVQEKYFSQDEASESFHVLSHFVVTYNPFRSDDQEEYFIVILNGVSGPGTFAVAEALTGGKSRNTAVVSEKVLKNVNEIWKMRGENFRGLEGFLDVTVTPRADDKKYKKEHKTPGSHEISERVKHNFHDQREVESWEMLKDANLPRNPRALK